MVSPSEMNLAGWMENGMVVKMVDMKVVQKVELWGPTMVIPWVASLVASKV